MLKNNTNNKQVFELNHKQTKSDSTRERMFNCNLKIMDNILLNHNNEHSDNEEDDAASNTNNDKDDTEFNRHKQLRIRTNKHIDYLTKLEACNSNSTKFKNDDVIDDQLDDEDDVEHHHSEMIRSDQLKKNDYLQMAMYYKNLCKVEHLLLLSSVGTSTRTRVMSIFF